MILELFKVKMGFVSNGDSIADYVWGFGALGFDVVGYVHGLVVGAFDHFPVEY